MPDLFNFWTTRTSDFTVPNMQSNLPDTALSDLNTSLDFTVDLTPKLPGGKKEESSRSLLEAQLGMILNTKGNAPQYTYTDKEARRYDSPGKQFTPGQLITGGDIEDLYAKNQSAWAKLGNAGLKTMANIGGTYVSAFLSIPKQIDMIRSGNKDDIIAAFTEDGILPSIQNSLMELEDKLPNYYTEWEREHPYLSAIPFSGGAVNFWGDKILKNIAFSVGALAAGVTQSAAIEYATAGMATPAAFLKLGSTIGKFLPNMFRGFRNLAKVSTFPGGIDDVINVARAGKSIEEAARTAATLRKIGHGGKLLLTNYLAAQGEAYIEGYHTYYQLKEDSYKKLLNGELSPEEAATIEERAQDAGRLTSKINIPIVMVSNLLQIPRLLGVKGMKDEILESFIKMQKGTQGFELVKNFSKAKAIRNYAWESITDMAKEGAEEGAQAAFSGAVRDYYMDKYSPVRQTLVGYVEEQLKDDELYQEMFLGALSGFLMGGVPSAKKYFWNTNQRLDKAIEQMQPVVQKFNEHVRGLHSAFEISNLENTEEQDQLARFKSLFNFVSTGRKFGTYDMFMDSIQDLKDLSLDDYNQMFNTLHKTDLDKRAHIDFLTNEISEINRSIDAVETLYRRNPYKTDSYLVEKIKDAFQIQGDDLEKTQAYLFDEFKTTMAFNHARMQKMSKAYDDYDNGLKSAGISTEPREYLINLARGDSKVLNQYKAYKVNQMNALNSQMDYLKEMQQQAKASTSEGATPQSYQKKIQIIQERLDKMRGTLDELDKLSKDLPRMKDKEKDEFADRRQLIYLLLLNEELTPADLQKLQEEMKEPTEEEVEAAKDTVEKAADTKDTMEEYQKEAENPEEALEEIVDLEAESLNQSAPPDTEKDSTPKTDDLWVDDYKEGQILEIRGYRFKVFKVVKSNDPNKESGLQLDSQDTKQIIPFFLQKRGDKFFLIVSKNYQHPIRLEQEFKPHSTPGYYEIEAGPIYIESFSEDPSKTLEAKIANIERKYTFTRDSLIEIADGTGLATKGTKILNPDRVASQFKIGDKIIFYAERERTGIWDGKTIREDKTGNSFGILGILIDVSGYIKNQTAINAELNALKQDEQPIEDKKILEENKKLGEEILENLNYKNHNRLPNGNVAGGQSGWKIRFNIKNPKTGRSYYTDTGKGELIDDYYRQASEKIAEFLDTYFQTDSKKYNNENSTAGYGKDSVGYRAGHPSGIWKNLHGGEYGESDFTIYIGSADDVLKFIHDVKTKYPEILELLDLGNISSDVVIDGPFKGRIEGKSLGFAGYHTPTNLNTVTGKNRLVFTYKDKQITIIYDNKNNDPAYPASLSNIYIQIEGERVAYGAVYDQRLKQNHPEIYNNIRTIIGFQMYGSYLTGSSNEFISIVNNQSFAGTKPEEEIQPEEVAEVEEPVQQEQEQIETPELKYEKGDQEFTFDEVMSNENYKFVPSRIQMKFGTLIYRSKGGKLYAQGSYGNRLDKPRELKPSEINKLRNETFNQVIMSTFIGGKVVERDQRLTKEKQEEILAPTQAQLVKQFLAQTEAKEDVETALISAVSNGLVEIQCT